jgi:hypothetical protein
MPTGQRSKSYYKGAWHGGSKGKGVLACNVEMSPSPFELAKRYKEATGKMLDWRPAFREMIPDVKSGIQNIIDGKGAPLGFLWGPLTAAYAKRKRGGGAMLWLTGNMLRTLGVSSLTKTSMRYGVESPQARAIQFGYRSPMKMGTRRGQLRARRTARSQGLGIGGTPARPFLGVSQSIVDAARLAFENFMAGVLDELNKGDDTPEVVE